MTFVPLLLCYNRLKIASLERQCRPNKMYNILAPYCLLVDLSYWFDLYIYLDLCHDLTLIGIPKTGQEFGADDFLPALSYVMVLCNMPEILLEVEYMMELLESSWLTGEGRDKYFLASQPIRQTPILLWYFLSCPLSQTKNNKMIIFLFKGVTI